MVHHVTAMSSRHIVIYLCRPSALCCLCLLHASCAVLLFASAHAPDQRYNCTCSTASPHTRIYSYWGVQ